MSTKRLQRKKGFTLIELLIVFVIMSLLTGLGIGAFMTSRLRARDAKRKGDLENIVRALELYYNDYGAYPTANTGGNGFVTADGTVVTWGGTFTNAGQLYMAEVPEDPGPYTYQYSLASTPQSGVGYILYARLENVEDSTVPLVTSGSEQVPGAYDGTDCDPSGTKKCNYFLRSSNSPTPGAEVID